MPLINPPGWQLRQKRKYFDARNCLPDDAALEDFADDFEFGEFGHAGGVNGWGNG